MSPFKSAKDWNSIKVTQWLSNFLNLVPIPLGLKKLHMELRIAKAFLLPQALLKVLPER